MSDAAWTFLRGGRAPFWVSDLAEAEVAAAVSRMVRTRDLTVDHGHAALAAFDQWLAAEATLAECEGADFRFAIDLVRRFDLMLRTPDALHLALSYRLSAELVTFDRRLALTAEVLGLPVRVP